MLYPLHRKVRLFALIYAKQTCKVNLPAFVGRLQTKEYILTINKIKITDEKTLNGYDFVTESNHELVKKKIIFCGYHFRFVNRALTVRPRNTYICFFCAMFGFCNF